MLQTEEQRLEVPVRPPATRTLDLVEELSKPLRNLFDKPRTIKRTTIEILVVVGVALALRLPYFHGRMFPLNDGGMFAQIVDDLRASHFILPTHTTYNFLDIPLSYPPLAFYLGALCTLLPGQSTLSVLVWLPLFLNLATLVTVYFIAREIYPSKFYACLTACCYASIGRSNEWLIMGGGLTRGTGILCASLAILFFVRARRCSLVQSGVCSGAFVGLSILSHLEGGIFAVSSLIMLSVLFPNRRRNLAALAIAGAASIFIVLPWVIWLYRHLGFGPLMNASHTGGEYSFPTTFAPAALLISATILAIVARFPYLCWLAVTPLILPRSGSTYGALIGGLCMVWVANAVVVLVTRRLHRVLQWRNAFLIVIAMTFSLLIHGIPRIHKDRVAELRDNSRAQVSPAEVHAMLAAARLSPANARFFVFNQRYGDWYTDMVAEWFPYIARRQSVDTVQGQEWLPNNAFQNAIEQQGEVELSGSPRVTAMILKQLNPDYIFIAEPFDKDPGKDAENQQALANSLRDYAGSPPIYENSEVAIYKIQRSHGQDRTNP